MKIHTPFPHLFTPLTVGNVRLRNRVIAAPVTSYAHEPSPADKFESIAAKARGGAGLIPRRELAESFAELAYDVRMIGDCIGARRINEAAHEGYFAGHFI